jgi:hypothetical protein
MKEGASVNESASKTDQGASGKMEENTPRGFRAWLAPRLRRIKPEGFWGWTSAFSLLALWFFFLIDLLLWYARASGDFS